MCSIKEEKNLLNNLGSAVQEIEWLYDLPEHLMNMDVVKYKMNRLQSLIKIADSYNIPTSKYLAKIQSN